MADALSQAVQASLITHNSESGHAWTFGTNWDNQGKEFEIKKYSPIADCEKPRNKKELYNLIRKGIYPNTYDGN